MIKFEGILGYNCGVPTDTKSIDKRTNEYDRSKEKGFIISGGIETLRGFARIGDLAKASTIDKGYQRSKDKNHIKDISIFLDEGRILSKFLPEVILVGNKDEVNLTPFTPSGKVSQTVLGEIKNLGYYKIEVAEKSLKRIDGNHRIEAGSRKNIIISFAIIIWPESDESYQENRDNEAFLFHFLNGKAKKLTPEENYKGLATSATWSVEELRHVNPVIPYLQLFLKFIEKSTAFNKDYFIEGPLSQISSVLEELNDFTISNDRFKKILGLTFNALDDFHKFPYLKSEFNFLLPQLAFINFYYDNPPEHLITISNWLKKFKYEKGSFENAKNLYEIADKQLKVVHLKVFVAMPFWKDNDGQGDLKEVIRYNRGYTQALKGVLGSLNPHINLDLIPIMLRKGKTVKIDSQLLNEIEEADIFIGDTTDNNPNVIFEIGYALALKKPTIIVRKKSYNILPPFDIDKLIYKQYDDAADLEISLSKILKVNIPVILKDDFDLIINLPSKEENKLGTIPKVSTIIENDKSSDAIKEEETKQSLDLYEEMYMVEAERAVSHVLSNSVWDFREKIVEIIENGKSIKINSLETLTDKLEEVAKDSGYPYIAAEGEEREIIFNNIDWSVAVLRGLENYTDKLEEIGWN